MSGFVANPTVSVSELNLTNDGWFPDIDMAALRAAIRLDGTITEARLRHAAVDAVASVNRELYEWQYQQIDAGHTTLAAMPSVQLDGRSRLHLLYLRAVYSTTKADLTERYRDYDSTASGNQRADDLTPSIDEQRRNARWAIRDILGRPHSTVELI